MKTINSTALAFLAVIAAAPGLAQDAEVFVGSICEIDTTPLNVPYTTPNGTRSAFTFNTQKDCSGVASKRNIKLACSAPLQGWTFGSKSAKNFPCTINPDQCGVTPKSSDTENPPYVTTRESILKVQSGVATLTCFYKP
ncbi:MAG TPA: hypothetical protein VGQ19_07015 [Burkholderiales bacterium]|jgi:hypothetical protein|nr:hypothetical protein [Burkholderiales bacterium]